MCLQFKFSTLFLCCLLATAIYCALEVTKFKLFPSDDGLMTYVQFETKPGTPLETTASLATQIEDIIKTHPTFVQSFVTNIGERTPTSSKLC